jgi:hypothetical protein
MLPGDRDLFSLPGWEQSKTENGLAWQISIKSARG